MTLNMGVNWYGIPIHMRHRYCVEPVAIDVREGVPLTPVLPYRHSIKEDERLETFWNFCRDRVVEFCIESINSSNVSKDNVYNITNLMITFSKIATQDELDRLNRFYINTENPYYNDDPYGDSTFGRKIVEKGETIFSEEVRVFDVEENKFIENLDSYLFLPEETITSVTTCERKPGWLNIREKDVLICIDRKEKVYARDFTWYKAEITSQDKDIRILALVDGWYEGKIFYCSDTEDVYSIHEAIFAAHHYNEEGDLIDTQREEFERYISEELSHVKKEYRITDLLDGMRKVGILPSDISLIKISRGKMIIKTQKAEDGDDHVKVLKVA
jgi:hypothetical protein